MIKALSIGFILLLLTVNVFAQQVSVTRDELPNTNSADSTAVLNNVLRQNQNAINSIGGYFNSSGYLSPANGGTGTNISGFPNGSLLIYDNGNIGIGTIFQGNIGQILTSNGVGSFPSFQDTPSSVHIFLTSGTYTATTSGVLLTMIGGGGAGGNSSGGVAQGGSGGAGGSYLKGYYYPTIVGNTYTVTVGTSNTASVFDVISVPAGGAGGSSGGAAGTSLTGSTSTLDYVGTGNGVIHSSNNGGAGGNTLFGSGSVGATGGNNATDCIGNTGAGGGGSGGGVGATTGGAGCAGFVIVQS